MWITDYQYNRKKSMLPAAVIKEVERLADNFLRNNKLHAWNETRSVKRKRKEA